MNKQNCDKKRVEEEKKGFGIHRLVYISVIALLAFINLSFTPEFIWFVFPLVGWGIGLAVHYINIRNLT